MAGTLVIDTLKASSGVLATQNGMTGIAKAWVNFNGSGAATVRSSFNVSSVTYNGSGDYTVNMTTALSDANFSAVVSSGYGTGGGQPTTAISAYSSASGIVAPTTTTFRFYCLYGGGFAVSSSTYYAVAIFGS